MTTLVSYRNGQVLSSSTGTGGAWLTNSIKNLLQRVGLVSVMLSAFSGGAVGDGVTNDTSAWQAAVDSVSAGGEVYVPKGVYALDTVKLYAGVKIKAEYGTQVLWRNNGAAGVAVGTAITLDSDVPTGTPCYSMFYVDQSAGKKADIVLEGFEILGDGANQNPGYSYAAINTDNATTMRLRNIKISNVCPGVTAASGFRAWCMLVHGSDKVWADACSFDNAGYDACGLRGSGQTEAWFTGCYFGDAPYGSIQAAYGVQALYLTNCKIKNNGSKAVSAAANGLYSHGCTNIYAINCDIETGSSSGGAVFAFGDLGADAVAATTTTIDSYAADDRYAGEHHYTNCRITSGGDKACVTFNTRYVRDCFCTNCTMIKTGTSAVVFQVSGEASGLQARRVCCTACVFRQMTSGSLMTLNYCREIDLVDCHFIKPPSATGNHGIQCTRVNRLRIVGGSSLGPANTAATADCRWLRLFKEGSNGCTEVVVREHKFLYDDEASPVPSWSRFIDCEDSTNFLNFIIEGNDLRGIGSTLAAGSELTGFTPGSGGFAVIRNNVGFKSQFRGSVTIASGSTNSGNIAHGLAAWKTWAGADVKVWFAGVIGNAKTCRVSSIDQTNLVVAVDQDPGATTAVVGYEITASAA